MKKILKYMHLCLLWNLCSSHSLIATPTILDNPNHPIHGAVTAFNTKKSVDTLREINDMGRDNDLAKAEQPASRGTDGDIMKPLQHIADFIIDEIPNCFCALEYMKFPLSEEAYREFIRFFATFPISLPERNEEDGEDINPKNKLANMCDLYWTLGQTDVEIRSAIDRVEQKYGLEFDKQEFGSFVVSGLLSCNFYNTAIMYGFCKILASRNLQYGISAGILACAMGGIYNASFWGSIS